MPEQMTKQDAIEYLMYMKHDVQAKSPVDIALDIAIESLKSAPMRTNADRIRQMTDDELAEFLLESRSRCKLCKKRDEICEGAYHECWNGIDDWLKQEVSEDAGTND